MLYGRLTLVAGDPGEVDAIPPPQERPLRPGEIPGLRAVYCLVDRTTGRAAALSIWEGREGAASGQWPDGGRVQPDTPTAEVVAARVSPQRPQARGR